MQHDINRFKNKTYSNVNNFSEFSNSIKKNINIYYVIYYQQHEITNVLKYVI